MIVPPGEQAPDGRFCPDCMRPYDDPSDDGIFDCRGCGLWTLPFFWQARSDTDYTRT